MQTSQNSGMINTNNQSINLSNNAQNSQGPS